MADKQEKAERVEGGSSTAGKDKPLIDAVELLQEGWRSNRADRLYDGGQVARSFRTIGDRLNAYWVTELNDSTTRKERLINPQEMNSLHESANQLNFNLSTLCNGMEAYFAAPEPFSAAQEAGNRGFLCVVYKGKTYISPKIDELQSLSEKSPELAAEVIQGRIAKGRMIEAPKFFEAFLKGVHPQATASDFSLSETISLCRAWAKHLEAHKDNAPWAEQQLRGLYSLETTQPVHRLRQLQAKISEKLAGRISEGLAARGYTAEGTRESETSERNENEVRENRKGGKLSEKAGALGLLLMFGNMALRSAQGDQ